MDRYIKTRGLGLMALPALLLAGCFSPSASPAGYSCSDADDRCPAGKICVNNICVDKNADSGADSGADKGADKGADQAQDMPPHDLPQGDLLTDDLPPLDIKLPDLSVPDMPQPDVSTTGCTPPKASASCVEDTLGHSWCRIPAGCFMMGSPSTEKCRDNASEDYHKVTLTRSYEVSATETTQGQFQQQLGRNPAHWGPNGTGASCGASCPVESVTWDEAAYYCNALSAAKGLPPCYACTGPVTSPACVTGTTFKTNKIYRCGGFRLPTDAEWEHAYRAGKSTALHSGGAVPVCNNVANADAHKIAWYYSNSGQKTHPVGTKTANGWGLRDMSGNVAEWCQDGWSASLGTVPDTDPATGSGGQRVMRGGAAGNSPDHIRAAMRLAKKQPVNTKSHGFRCARTRNAGLTAHWQLDGGSAHDSQGTHHGQRVGTTVVTGVVGGALSFDGKSDRVETKFKPVWQSTDSFSVSAWAKTSATGTASTVFGFEANQKGDVKLHFWTDGKVGFRVRDDNGKDGEVKSGASYNDGKWHHLVGVRDGLSKKLLLYVDGKREESSIDNTSAAINASSKLGAAIGSTAHGVNTSNPFKGSIDDVRVHSRALYPGEVLELYKHKPCDWTAVPVKNLPLARRAVGSTDAVNGQIYLLGGTHTTAHTYQKSIYRYDIWNNVYTNLGDLLPYGMNLKPHNIALHSDGKFYISPAIENGTGGTKKDVVIFDPATGKTAVSAATFSSSVWDMAVVSGGDGMVYFLGGYPYVSGKPGGSIHQYDPVMDTLTPMGTMPMQGNAVSATMRASNGMIYVFGNGYSKKLIEFDPVKKVIKTYVQPAAAETVAWEYPRGTLRTFSGWGNVFSFDLSTKQFSKLQPLPASAWGKHQGQDVFPHTVSVDRGTGSLFAFGGEAGPVWPLKNAYRLDCLK